MAAMFSMILNEVVPPLPPPEAAAVPAPKFPTYLLPSFSRPFRRYHRTSSSGNAPPAHSDHVPSLSNSPTDSVLSDAQSNSYPAASPRSSPPSPSWVARVRAGLRPSHIGPPGGSRLARIQPDTIRCSTCGTDFAFYSQIVSKGFTGRNGRAYLVAPPDGPPQKAGPNLMNIKVGKSETRLLSTGSHVVCDIQCAICRARVGWKYVDAKEESQKYKIGKFILETQRTVDYSNWDDTTAEEVTGLEFEENRVHDGGEEAPVVFDSDDEDDCEDLFAGAWEARIAARRRKLKQSRRRK
ncbi:yippee-domain-containing protein [Xylaria palmicola]|nr:yippee-domain-containing protein [Xylaria palmicola]